MREIKFRAFTPVDKTMHQPLDIKKIMKVGWVSEDCILMQFTGLLDKNGKEVFEGDIIKAPNGTYRVEWDSFGFLYKGFVLFGKNPKYYATKKTIYPQDCEVIEVIGNIYENPELLER